MISVIPVSYTHLDVYKRQDIVCEWNYELILDAEAHRSDPKDFNDYNEYQSRYESLKADEKRLDRLFDKTSYGKELIEVATELADRVIAQLGNKELEKAAVTVAEGVREYSTGKKMCIRDSAGSVQDSVFGGIFRI